MCTPLSSQECVVGFFPVLRGNQEHNYAQVNMHKWELANSLVSSRVVGLQLCTLMINSASARLHYIIIMFNKCVNTFQ